MVNSNIFRPERNFREGLVKPSRPSFSPRQAMNNPHDKQTYYWAWGKKDGRLAIDGYFVSYQECEAKAASIFPGIYNIHESSHKTSIEATREIKHLYAEQEKDIFEGIKRASHKFGE